MDAAIIVALIMAPVSLGGSWLVARSTATRHDFESREAERTRIRHLEQRVDDLEGKREVDAITKRRLGDHIDLLEHHIWQRKEPPPPPRPAGI